MRVVHGIYDGKVVRLLEPAQVENPCRVTVTFPQPTKRGTLAAGEDSLERFFGMWADFAPEEEQAFQTILEERASYFTGRDLELDEGDLTQ